MNVEKTVEFLLSESAKHDQQIGQLTSSMIRLVEQTSILVELQKRLSEETDKKFRETDGQLRELKELIKNNEERRRKADEILDQRISALVSSIGAITSKLS